MILYTAWTQQNKTVSRKPCFNGALIIISDESHSHIPPDFYDTEHGEPFRNCTREHEPIDLHRAISRCCFRVFHYFLESCKYAAICRCWSSAYCYLIPAPVTTVRTVQTVKQVTHEVMTIYNTYSKQQHFCTSTPHRTWNVAFSNAHRTFGATNRLGKYVMATDIQVSRKIYIWRLPASG